MRERKKVVYQDILTEFETYVDSLPVENQNNKFLWEEFLLMRDDDRSDIFARTVNDACLTVKDEIIDLKKEGKQEKSEEVAKMNNLRNRLAKRYKGMYQTIKLANDNTVEIRVNSKPIFV